MAQKCDMKALTKKVVTARRMPVASKMRPLRNHLLRLAIDSAKHGYCQRAGQEIRKAKQIAERDPDDITYARAVRNAKGLAGGRRKARRKKR